MLKLQKKPADLAPVTVDQIGTRVTDDEIPVETDPRKAIRLGLWVLILGFGGFMLWALLAPLDAGVPANGVVSVESQRKTVQHLSGGIIESIKVQDGDAVKAGQVLMTLNPTQARAQAEILRNQYFSALAVENRLMTEYADRESIRFDKDLLDHKSDPKVAEIIDVQTTLFKTRRASQRRQAAVLKESSDALNVQLKGMRELATEGYIPRNKMLDAERSSAEIRLRVMQQEQEYRKQVESMLGDAQKETSTLRDRLVAAQEDLTRTEIKAPVDGVVMALAFHTIGGVVSPGGRILDIVPGDEPLIIEAQIEPHLIDQVKVGMIGDLHFQAFNQNKTPVIEGIVTTVSADRIVDPGSHQAFYLVRVKVPTEQVKRLGSNRIQPGMPVQVVLKSGERTLMNYLLKPLFDRFSSALKER